MDNRGKITTMIVNASEMSQNKDCGNELIIHEDNLKRLIDDLVNLLPIHDVSCCYLVYLYMDYEGIQDEMYLFKSKKKAIDKMNELNANPKKWDGEEYHVKKLNCN